MLTGDKQNNLSLIYERERKEIELRLNNIIKNRKPSSLYKPGNYILEGGGKRLRPILVLLSAKAVGGSISSFYNAAIAVELLHNFTLVHDDIMDNADKRRGRITLHKKYDLSTAILVGDSLLSVAYEYLLKDCNGNTKEILVTFTKGLVDVCEGQSLDKEYEVLKQVTLKEYLFMIEKKTAAMAEMCCKMGALLGNGTKDEVNALAKFGRNLGIAFQIQDDLLDIIGDEKEFGKICGGDLVEGKKTFLLLKALEVAKGDDLKKIKLIVKQRGISPDLIEEYKNIYLKLGVIEEAKKEIKKFSVKALKSLLVLKNEEDRFILTALADSLIDRNK